MWGSYRHNTGSRTDGLLVCGLLGLVTGHVALQFILNPVTSEWDCFHSSQPLQGLPDARTDLAVRL